MTATPHTPPTAQQADDAWRAVEIIVARRLTVRRKGQLWAAMDARGGLVASGPDPVAAAFEAEAVLDAGEETSFRRAAREALQWVEQAGLTFRPRLVDAGTSSERHVWDVLEGDDPILTDQNSFQQAVRAARLAKEPPP